MRHPWWKSRNVDEDDTLKQGIIDKLGHTDSSKMISNILIEKT